MKKISDHSVLRLLVVILLTAALVRFIPYSGADLVAFLETHAINVGILYAIIIGFLMSLAIARRQKLEEYVSLELNKIRRLNHLGLHLAKLDPPLEPWFGRLRAAIDAYQARFRQAHFIDYEEGNPLFRAVTYAIYELPLTGRPYNADLYGALLDAAGSATEAREFIRANIARSITRYQWLIISLVTLTFCGIITAATPPDFTSRFYTGLVIFNVILTLEMLNRYDRMGAGRSRRLSNYYVWNLTKK